MSSARLKRIQNWPKRAHEVRYSVKALADHCGVSVRALELFFSSTRRESPSSWLKRLRMQRAIELLRDGSNVNETADCLGYRDRSHFSRQFKRHYGLAPKLFALCPKKAETTLFAHLAT
jgi:transcriptional regulator GlxA family with amidase domain